MTMTHSIYKTVYALHSMGFLLSLCWDWTSFLYALMAQSFTSALTKQFKSHWKISQWLVGFPLFIVNAIYTTRKYCHQCERPLKNTFHSHSFSVSVRVFVLLLTSGALFFNRFTLYLYASFFSPVHTLNATVSHLHMASCLDLISIYIIHTRITLYAFFLLWTFILSRSIRLKWKMPVNAVQSSRNQTIPRVAAYGERIVIIIMNLNRLDAIDCIDCVYWTHILTANFVWHTFCFCTCTHTLTFSSHSYAEHAHKLTSPNTHIRCQKKRSCSNFLF